MPYANQTTQQYNTFQGDNPAEGIEKTLVTGTWPHLAEERHLPFVHEALDYLGLENSVEIVRSRHSYFRDSYNLVLHETDGERRFRWVPVMGCAVLAAYLTHDRHMGSRQTIVVGMAGSTDPAIHIGDYLAPRETWGNDNAMMHRLDQPDNRIFRPDATLQTSLVKRLRTLSGATPIHNNPTTTCEVMSEQTSAMATHWQRQGYGAVEMELAYTLAHGEAKGLAAAGLLFVCDELWPGGTAINDPRFKLTLEQRDAARRNIYIAALGELFASPGELV